MADDKITLRVSRAELAAVYAALMNSSAKLDPDTARAANYFTAYLGYNSEFTPEFLARMKEDAETIGRTRVPSPKPKSAMKMENGDDVSFGDRLSVNQFLDYCSENSLTDYDGCGYYGDGVTFRYDLLVAPSMTQAPGYMAPEGMTHVVWFNK